MEIESTGAILWLWVLGGLCALCGALCYAELGAHHTASGGEYHFLTALIHPYAGFLSGCVSATVGFAAPIALASLTFGIYLATAFPSLPPKITATTLIALMVFIHTRTYRESSQISIEHKGESMLAATTCGDYRCGSAFFTIGIFMLTRRLIN